MFLLAPHLSDNSRAMPVKFLSSRREKKLSDSSAWSGRTSALESQGFFHGPAYRTRCHTRCFIARIPIALGESFGVQCPPKFDPSDTVLFMNEKRFRAASFRTCLSNPSIRKALSSSLRQRFVSGRKTKSVPGHVPVIRTRCSLSGPANHLCSNCLVNFAVLRQPGHVPLNGPFFDFTKKLHRFRFITRFCRIIFRNHELHVDCDDVSISMNEPRPLDSLTGNSH